MSIEQIILLFKDVAERHKQINGFVVSEDYNLGEIDDNDFPLLAIVPKDANLPRDENGFSMFTIGFEVKLLDLVNDDLDNKIHVYSDAVEILKDIVNEFNTHPYYIDNSIDITEDATIVKLEEFTDVDLYGYGTELTLASPNKISFCGSPITNLSGFDFTPASVTVIDGETTTELYPSDTYTCTPVMPASGIAYDIIKVSGLKTSYRPFDEVANIISGKYITNEPAYPIHYAKLDIDAVDSFSTLVNFNHFGVNKNRFTDENGLQVYGNDYFIDHLTKRGYLYNDHNNGVKFSVKNLTDCLSYANSYTHTALGYNDFRIPNKYEVTRLVNSNTTNTFNWFPLNNTSYSIGTFYLWQSTALASSPALTGVRMNIGGTTLSHNVTSTSIYVLVRNHEF